MPATAHRASSNKTKTTNNRDERAVSGDLMIREIVCDLPRLCTRSEAAAVLRKSTRTIDRWIEGGALHATRPVGGLPLIPRAEIARLLRDGETVNATRSRSANAGRRIQEPAL
jgi:excisionase family DNA binding protein